ncbi:MAG TPA: carbon monoxide dehydrogenase subunit G [Ktedonobacterales bacterium]|nr:carbon monoxide dehydrogenase subunit G [Ktedonobacterales bacterium]
MHFEGDQTLNSPIETVWAYFMDPEKVAACAPGFKSMETLGPDHFKPTLAVGVGAVKATFTLDVTLQDLQPPNHAAVVARGNAAGSAVDMRSEMNLTAESEAVTKLHWTADVNVSGTIASMGARLMEGTAQKLTERFFDCLRQNLPASSAS